MVQHIATATTEVAARSSVSQGGSRSSQDSGRGDEFASVFARQESFESKQAKLVQAESRQQADRQQEIKAAERRQERDNQELTRAQAKQEQAKQNQDVQETAQVNKEQPEQQEIAEKQVVKEQPEKPVKKADKEVKADTPVAVKDNRVEDDAELATQEQEEAAFDWLGLLDKQRGVVESGTVAEKDKAGDGKVSLPGIPVDGEEGQTTLTEVSTKQVTDSTHIVPERQIVSLAEIAERLKEGPEPESEAELIAAAQQLLAELSGVATDSEQGEPQEGSSDPELASLIKALSASRGQTDAAAEGQTEAEAAVPEVAIELVSDIDAVPVEAPVTDTAVDLLAQNPELGEVEASEENAELLVQLLEPEVEAEVQTDAEPQVAAQVTPEVKAKPEAEKAPAIDPELLNKIEAGLAKLAELPEEKLDSVLQNIAQRVTIPEGQSKNEFVAQLKAGLQEFKAQLQQGREPGIDLASLITEAAANVEGADNIEQQLVQQVTRQINLIADISQRANNGNEAVQSLTQNLAVGEKQLQRESNVTQLETAKQLQNQQTQTDKAINIAAPDAAQKLADKVGLMVNQKNLTAEIRLDPPELGSMLVKVNLQGDSASVNFVVQSQQAKDVLDQSAAKLRDMLSEQGINLGQSDVQQESRGQQADDNGAGGGRFASGANDDELVDESVENNHSEVRVVNGALGGIDYFA